MIPPCSTRGGETNQKPFKEILLAAQAHWRIDGMQTVLLPLSYQEANFGHALGNKKMPGIVYGEKPLISTYQLYLVGRQAELLAVAVKIDQIWNFLITDEIHNQSFFHDSSPFEIKLRSMQHPRSKPCACAQCHERVGPPAKKNP